jgi:hypothetical protein
MQDSRLYGLPAGHAPWLVDPQRAARLIAEHLTAGPHPPTAEHAIAQL